jgi:hypothetical protein
VASLVLVTYSLWLAIVFKNNRDPRDFTIIDTTILHHCHASSVIHVDPTYHYPPPNVGYDGAFYYLIALDPLHAACYLDKASYRYTRILYPITARLLALGQANWIPATLILTNLLAIAGGTLALALWLRRRDLSPWFALIYGFYPGLFVSLWRDLTEPLSYAFVALAVYLFDSIGSSGAAERSVKAAGRGLKPTGRSLKPAGRSLKPGRRQLVWLTGLCFALAVLARETALVFAVVYGLALLRRNRGAGIELLGIALLPFLVYKLILLVWLGSAGIEQTVDYPLGGLIHYWPWAGEYQDLALAVVLPALVCAVMGLWALARRIWTPEVVCLLLNILPFVVLLPAVSYAEYFATGRATTGVILAALLCLPALDRLTAGNRSWLWISSVFWLLPWYSLVPQGLFWADPKL